jgi:uncharacterized protein YoxC
MPNKVDSTIDDMDKTMKLLRASLRGIPLRTGSFHKQHDNLTREVAHLLVELDSARGFIK